MRYTIEEPIFVVRGVIEQNDGAFKSYSKSENRPIMKILCLFNMD